ncbi:MAG: DUF3141 domain-containing protein [Leptothrix sp. (in: b-proteobacteria)]
MDSIFHFEAPDAGLTAWPGADYACDALERHVLFLDAMRQRGNIYVEHVNAGEPDLLKFDHEVVLDGRDLPRPCNYALLRIVDPSGAEPDPAARPVMVVDPRAGHGPGIGGFKPESEVGMALRAGHPVYFVTFRPQPVEGQTLLDVATAEARFLEAIIERHPDSPARPLVIGNCQAGWAMAGLAAMRPELFGPLILVGSPLSYWAGSSQMNPMRYAGATLGGAWLAALTSDLGADRFDGAHLVKNFENLNPANSLWGRYYRLWSQVDTEAERFLDFERWWGGYFRMSGAEIEAIVENLFIGNRLARGDLVVGDQRLDLRHITAPVVVFASWGDNITPPPQALNWIIDTWGDERAIAAAGRVIVYVLHETVGHLGIFVGTDVARKEHDQIVTSLDVIENLPPGLYEMHLLRKDGGTPAPGDALEPGAYTVHFEHRTMDHLRALNPEGRDEEQLFSTVAQVSEINTAAYKTWVRPWLRPLASRALADAATHLHPLRRQRQLMSDIHPGAKPLSVWAEHVRGHRHTVADDHPARQVERALSSGIEGALNLWRDLRDQATVHYTRWAFGASGLGAWLPPDVPDEVRAQARAQAELDQVRSEVLGQVADGGFPQAVCRIVMAAMLRSGAFERRGLRLIQRLAERRLPPVDGQPGRAMFDWHRGVRFEARIDAVAPNEALDALGAMLPDPAARLRALAIAAAAVMISESAPPADEERVIGADATPRQQQQLDAHEQARQKPRHHQAARNLIDRLIEQLGADRAQVLALAADLADLADLSLPAA